MEFSTEILVLLFFLAILAGWVDTIAGGGGLITIPVLILAGLPPATALATNKLQGSAGTLTASIYFLRKKTVRLSELKLAIFLTFIGSIVGSWLVLKIDSQYLIVVLPILLICMGIYFLFSPNISNEDKKRKISMTAFSILVASALGFYDGFFGPGTGSLMALCFVLFLGYSLPKATANSKILNFVSNLSALAYFIFFGDINWTIGILMMSGQYIGAILGGKMIIEKGTALIKPVVVTVCFLMSLNILLKSYF